MAETETVDAVQTPPDVQPPAVIREVEHRDFVETFTVREEGKRYEVAANAIANRAKMQVTVAKMRDLCARAIKPFFDNPELAPSPKDLKAIVDAVAIVEDMAIMSYSDSKKGGNLANSLERLAYAVTRGAVEGAAQKTGDNHAPRARLNRLIRIGKSAKEKKEEPIDVTPAQ